MDKETSKNYELINQCTDTLLAAIGSEVMALSLYRLNKHEGDLKMVTDAMANIFVETVRFQNAAGISREEFHEKFSQRLKELYPLREEKEDAES